MDAMPQGDGSEFFSVFDVTVLARWIHFAAVFILFGSAFFWSYMEEARRSDDRGGLPRTLRATTILLRVAAPVAAISGVVWLACLLANMTNGFSSVVDPDTLRTFFLQTQFGPVAALRLALLAAAVPIVLLPWQNRAVTSALMHIGALLLIDQAWLGHAAEGGAGLYGMVMIVVYSVHVLAVGAWVGGLPPLLFARVEQRDFSPAEAREATLDILSRYSVMAMVAVSLIVVTGIANAGFRVGGSFDRLFDTHYGCVLSTKASVVAVMLGLACFNRFVAMPRLRAAPKADMTQIARLRASVACELVLGVLVLAVAAVLGVTPPPQ